MRGGTDVGRVAGSSPAEIASYHRVIKSPEPFAALALELARLGTPA